MKVLYVDDERSALNSFAVDHAKDGISVECFQNARALPELLANKSQKDLPDVVVMDLYITNEKTNSPEAIKTNKDVDELVARIAKVRAELADLVNKEKTPAAIDALKEIRNNPNTKHVPVILVTREGLALLGDSLVQQSLEMGAEWMIKGRAPETIRALINRTHTQSLASRRRLKRDVTLTLFGALLGAVLGTILGVLF